MSLALNSSYEASETRASRLAMNKFGTVACHLARGVSKTRLVGDEEEGIDGATDDLVVGGTLACYVRRR